MKREPKVPVGLEAIGYITRPSSPRPVYAEDFSILVAKPRRLRMKRGHIRVLH